MAGTLLEQTEEIYLQCPGNHDEVWLPIFRENLLAGLRSLVPSQCQVCQWRPDSDLLQQSLADIVSEQEFHHLCAFPMAPMFPIVTAAKFPMLPTVCEGTINPTTPRREVMLRIF